MKARLPEIADARPVQAASVQLPLRRSVLAMSVMARLMLAGGAIGCLWLAVVWSTQ
jgi:hypothetical protein